MAMNDSTVVAQSLYFEGRTAEAERLFREVLREQPDDVAALEGLGVLLLQQGRPGEAAALFARVLAVEPDSPPRLRANLGEALRSLGRLDEALEHLRRATELDPGLAQAWNSLGLLAHARGHYDYAEVAYRESLRLRPKFVPSHINLANALLARGRMGEAVEELRRALEIEPNQAIALMNLGRVLAELREPDRLDEAEALSRRAVELMPTVPYARANLGRVLRIRGRLDEARAYDEQARLLAADRAASAGPSAPAPRPQVAADIVRAGDTASRPHAPDGRADATPADSATARHARGLVAFRSGRLDEAEARFREALDADPTLAHSWLGLARIQEQRGDLELSCQSARQALAIRPDLAEAHAMLGLTLRGRLPDDELRAMRGRLDDPGVSPEDRALLHFGLAAALDGRGLFAEAAAHLEAGNSLQSSMRAVRGLARDADEGSLVFERIVAAYTPDLLARCRGWGDPDPRPVFVVGLPRTGTTLTEQILASHAEIHGAGELQFVSAAFKSLPERVGDPTADPFDILDRLTPEATREAGRGYIERLDALSPPGATRVVDKQPDNVNHLGLIALLWPGSRVIMCHRDLRDVAVSCWQVGYTTNPWINEWENIARRFADHQRVLEHWRRTRPLEWLDVSYEDLVLDPDGQARRMIGYLGLEWDPACLRFHENRRVVRTPSLAQVRQPLYTHSVGRWRNYEPFIQPLFHAFERHGVRIETRD
jgi:tetratricopeptide (TPR) repeat protein